MSGAGRRRRLPRIEHRVIAAKCRSTPGRWVLAGEFRTLPRSTIRNIALGVIEAYEPPGAYEGQARLTEFTYNLYVRFTDTS